MSTATTTTTHLFRNDNPTFPSENFDNKTSHIKVLRDFSEVSQIIDYIQKNHESFQPYDWTAIPSIFKEKEFRFSETSLKIGDLTPLLEKISIENFDLNQLNLMVEFCFLRSIKGSAYHRFLEKALSKITDQTDLETFFRKFHNELPIEIWINFLKDAKFPHQTENLFLKYFPRNFEENDPKILNLKNLLHTQRFSEVQSVHSENADYKNPETLSNFLQTFEIDRRRNFEDFLRVCKNKKYFFTPKHWDQFFERVNKRRGALDYLEEIRQILNGISLTKDPFTPSQVVLTIIKAFPYLKKGDSAELFLFRELCSKAFLLNDQDMIKLITLLPKNFAFKKFFFPLLKDCLNTRFSKYNIYKHYDLFSEVVNFWGFYQKNTAPLEYQSSHDETMDLFIQIADHVLVRLKVQQKNLIFKGISQVCEKGYPCPPEFIERINQSILNKLNTSKHPKHKKFNILRGMESCARAHYFCEEWIPIFLNNQHIFIQFDTFLIIKTLAKIGYLNENCSEEIKKIVRSLIPYYGSYQNHNFFHLSNAIWLAYSAAFIYEKESQDLYHQIIDKAFSLFQTQSRDLDPHDKRLLCQAMFLTDYPKNWVPRGFHNVLLDPQIKQSSIVEKISDEISKIAKTDPILSKGKIQTNVSFETENVAMRIDGISKDGRPIFIDINEEHLRTINTNKEIGKALSKHLMLKKSGHLVVIRAEGVNDPKTNEKIQQALKDIKSFCSVEK